MKIVIFFIVIFLLMSCEDSHQKQIENLKESLGSCISILQKERSSKRKIEKCVPKIKVTKIKCVVPKELKKQLEVCQKKHDSKMQKFAECISLIKEGTKVIEQCVKDKALQKQIIRKCNKMLQECKRN